MKNRIILITALLGFLCAPPAEAQAQAKPDAGATPAAAAQTKPETQSPAPNPSAATGQAPATEKAPADTKAQAEAKPQGPPPPVPSRPVYVRRFSLGGRLSILGLNNMLSGTAEWTDATIPAAYKYTSESKSHRAGGGPTVQFALFERLALSVDFFYRKTGYKRNGEVRTGVDNPSTPQDERVLTTTEEQVRMSYWEVPVLGRWYSQGRHEAGWRYFYQAGIAFRRAGDTVSYASVNGKCCTEGTASPAHKTTQGLVGGAGIQIYDNFGIKIIPEVRYTWWKEHMIDARPARSATHQVEAIIGITF